MHRLFATFAEKTESDSFETMDDKEQWPGLPKGIKPYDWALEQLNVRSAHSITTGSKQLTVALVDLGYCHHPALDNHLWVNPDPKKSDVHGWDFVDDDASLEPASMREGASHYYRNPHVFVTGEIAALVPDCPIMIVRVGYGNPDSWWQGIRYAVDQGARIIVIPHAYHTGEKATGKSFYSQGVDFTFPFDNPGIREALDYAWNKGCLIFKGSADNQGRRVFTLYAAVQSVFAVGTTNRKDEPADICPSSDYVKAGAPGGERNSENEQDLIWGLGGDENYISFSGGCMASGFAGGVAALAWSQFPDLDNHQIAQILRNTARTPSNTETNEEGWEPHLGYGILDASRAVSLQPDELCRNVKADSSSAKILGNGDKQFLFIYIQNHGVFDAEQAIAVVYNGDPTKPVDPEGTLKKPAPPLQMRQVGHSVFPIRGFQNKSISIVLDNEHLKKETLWIEVFCLDVNDEGRLQREKITLTE